MIYCLLLLIVIFVLVLLFVVIMVVVQDYDSDYILLLCCELQFNKIWQCLIEGCMCMVRQLLVICCVEDQNWGQSCCMFWVIEGCCVEFVVDEQGCGCWLGCGWDCDWDDDGECLVCEFYEQKDKECCIWVCYEVCLVKQKLVMLCVEDCNWGWDCRGVWVSDGCCVEFCVY